MHWAELLHTEIRSAGNIEREYCHQSEHRGVGEVALYVKRMWKQEMVVTARIQKRHQLTVAKLTAAKRPQQPVKATRPAKAPVTAIATLPCSLPTGARTVAARHNQGVRVMPYRRLFEWLSLTQLQIPQPPNDTQQYVVFVFELEIAM